MKVLIAVDSSAFAHEVLKAVAERLWPQDCEFRVITIVEPCINWEGEQQFLRQAEIILEERLKYLKTALPQHKIVGEVAVGHAAKMIRAAATTFHADLIVLGSHGDTGVRHSQIGSVAAAVVNEAPCSVELIKVSRLEMDNAIADVFSAA